MNIKNKVKDCLLFLSVEMKSITLLQSSKEPTYTQL